MPGARPLTNTAFLSGLGGRRAGPGFQPDLVGGEPAVDTNRHVSRAPGPLCGLNSNFHIEEGARSTIWHAAKHTRKKRTRPQNGGPVVQYAVMRNGIISRGERAKRGRRVWEDDCAAPATRGILLRPVRITTHATACQSCNVVPCLC